MLRGRVHPGGGGGHCVPSSCCKTCVRRRGTGPGEGVCLAHAPAPTVPGLPQARRLPVGPGPSWAEGSSEVTDTGRGWGTPPPGESSHLMKFWERPHGGRQVSSLQGRTALHTRGDWGLHPRRLRGGGHCLAPALAPPTPPAAPPAEGRACSSGTPALALPPPRAPVGPRDWGLCPVLSSGCRGITLWLLDGLHGPGFLQAASALGPDGGGGRSGSPRCHPSRSLASRIHGNGPSPGALGGNQPVPNRTAAQGGPVSSDPRTIRKSMCVVWSHYLCGRHCRRWGGGGSWSATRQRALGTGPRRHITARGQPALHPADGGSHARGAQVCGHASSGLGASGSAPSAASVGASRRGGVTSVNGKPRTSPCRGRIWKRHGWKFDECD